MTAEQIVRMIDATAMRVPSFYLLSVRETWVRRWVPYDWFGSPVIMARTALLAEVTT